MIAGIDFSTKEVYIVRRPDGEIGTPLVRRIKIENFAAYAERDALAAREAAKAIRSDPDFWNDVWLCGVEYPFTMTMGSVGLKTMLGAIVAAIPNDVHVLPLPARLWAPWFLREDPAGPLPTVPRKSAERKPLIKARALAMLGTGDVYAQDAYDALGISWAAELINREAIVAA